MYRWKPSAWFKWAPMGAGLPFLAAAAITSPLLHQEVAKTAENALKSVATWATVEFDGRDAALRGDGPSQKAIDDAVKTVAATYGVRTVNNLTRIVEVVNLEAPAAESQVAAGTLPVLKGKWTEGAAKTLSVTVAGTTYTLGKDAELTSAGGVWTLKPTVPIADGTYDIVAETTDGGSVSARSATPGKLVIDTEPPMAPVLAPAPTGQAWPYAITGTWPEGDAKSLLATLQSKTFALGRDAELTSDGKGNFSFAPKIDLPPGTHDVTVTVADELGNSRVFKSQIVIPALVKVPEPVPPPAAAADTTPPVAPKLDVPAVDAKWPYVVTGSWPVGDAKAFAVTLRGKTYTLGRDVELLTDTAGRFTFAPKVELPPGSHDLDFILKDAAGNTTNYKSPAAIVIPQPPVPPPPKQEPEPAPKRAELPAPTVTPLLDLSGAAVIRGAWPAHVASGLTVTVNNRPYKLGADANLRTDDKGNWSLIVNKPLPDGIYDVVVDVTDDAGQTKRDTTLGELEIDATLPAPPAVEVYSGESAPTTIKGTWGSARARSLQLSIPAVNMAAALGDPSLATDGDAWTWTLPQSLPPGKYNVMVATADKHGRGQTDPSTDEIEVRTPKPAPEPIDKAQAPVVKPAQAAPEPVPESTPVAIPASAPYDCGDALARISNVFPIRFEYDRTRLIPPYEFLINQYSSLLTDKRCDRMRLEIRGHADDRGPVSYNQVLSELRAIRIRDELVTAGVDLKRLTAVGFNESRPVDPENTEIARAKNRRVELTPIK